MAKIKLEPRAEYSPVELIDIYRADKNKSPQDIITLGKKLGLDDPSFFDYEYKDKSKRGKYFEPTPEGQALREKYVPKVLKDLQNEYFSALDKINLVTSERDTLPAQDGYKTETFDIRKQPGSRAIKEGSRPSVQLNTPEAPILTGDDEKKSFFDRLLSKENRPFLENLGMQLGTNLTAPMNPGENRSLMNQVARSVQGASVQTSAQEKAEIDKLLSTAQAKKALSESSGVPKEYKVAYAEVKSRGEPKEFIISEGKQITNPEFGVAVANVQAGNTRKEGLLTGKVNALTKLTDLYSKLGVSGLTPEKKLEIENSINMLQKEIGLMDGGESSDNNIDLSKKKRI